MNTVLPASPSHLEAGLSLDERIVAAEYAVIERDQRLRRESGRFFERLRVKTRGGARIAAVAAIVPFLLGWFMARNAPRSREQGDEQRHHPRLAEAPWAGLLPLLWPLLPASVRSRVSPGVASFLTGIGLPVIAQRLSKRRARAKAKAEAAAAGNGAAPAHH